MYLKPTLTIIVEALREVFSDSYPNSDFRNINITPEFPIQEHDFPAIWVEFSDTDPFERVSIDHREWMLGDDGECHEVNRYMFGGELSFTCAALTSLELARLYDELIRVLAFSGVSDAPSNSFRAYIEGNDLIDMNINYDEITPSPGDANPGTPWSTTEVLYEKTATVSMIGTCASDPNDGASLINLSRIDVTDYVEGTEPSDYPPDPDDVDPTIPYDPTQWI